MPEYLFPGVHVKEFNSVVVPVGDGAEASGFVGLALKGPVGGAPRLVTGISDFQRNYGGHLSADEFGDYRYLAYAVEHFFINGGTRAYILRVAPPDAKSARSLLEGPLKLVASSVGAWGNDLKAVITPASKAKTQITELVSSTLARVENSDGFNAGDVVAFTDGEETKYNRIVNVQDDVLELLLEFDESVIGSDILSNKILYTCEFDLSVCHADISESYSNLSLNINIPDFISKRLSGSELVKVELEKLPEYAISPYDMIAFSDNAQENGLTVAFGGGSDGSAEAVTADVFIGKGSSPGERTGIQAFLDNKSVSMLAVPGITDLSVQLALVSHCESLASRFAVLDMPKSLVTADELLARRALVAVKYAAMYHPWLYVFDPLHRCSTYIPPSGSMMGIYARTGGASGAHQTLINEAVSGCNGLSVSYSKDELETARPRGLNLIRMIQRSGISACDVRSSRSGSLWKNINVRRLLIYVEERIKACTDWVIFEPNDEALWAKATASITSFLETLWRSGELMGSSPSEAFCVQIGRATMTQDDIESGRLICVIGIAPVEPAEFVVFRMSQKTASL